MSTDLMSCYYFFALGRSTLLFSLSRLTAVALAVAGCVATPSTGDAVLTTPDPMYLTMYGPRPEERFALPATDITVVAPQFLRREVAYASPEPPGTIVVDTAARYLYLVRENGRALRYGIGVGADGMKWAGRAQVGRKAEWPRWTPTAAMIRRDPERNGPWAAGMPPGLTNPLGPRALYLFQNGRDTLYRIHGTNEPHTIGDAVSSGCIRLLNQDIVDLYSRVPVGSPVVVLTEAQVVKGTGPNSPEHSVSHISRGHFATAASMAHD